MGLKSRKKSNRRFLLKFSPILLLALIIVFLFFIFRSNFFAIRYIDVNLDKINCADSNQIKDSSNLLGQNLFFLNIPKVEKNLKNKYVCIKAIIISKNFPNKVKLNIFGREALAILVSLKNEESSSSATLEKFSENISSPSAESSSSAIFSFSENGGENFVVDNEGVIYSQDSSGLNVPNIYFHGENLALGQKIKGDLIINALRILDRIKILGVGVKEAKFWENIFLINASPKIIFKIDGDVNTQLASLQLILNKAKIDQDVVEFIDLRFDKPIVRFAPKKHG